MLGGGAIGLGAALALAAAGATRIGIVDASPLRRERLAEVCPFHIHGTDDPTLPDAGTVEFIIDAVGVKATREMAFRLVAPGGVIAHIGLGSASGGVDARRTTLQEIAFFGTYTYTADDFRATADALFAGRLGPVDWFEAHALEDGAAMFKVLHQGAVAAPKVVLQPRG